MANSVTVTAQANLVTTDGVSESLGASSFAVSMAGKNVSKGTQVTGSAAAIPLGGIGTIGLAVLKNLDGTNSIAIRNGSGGSNFLTVGPGETAVFRFTSGVVPFSVALAGTPLLEYMICEN